MGIKVEELLKLRSSKLFIGFIAIFLVVAIGSVFKYRHDISSLKTAYIAKQKNETDIIAKDVESKLFNIYMAIRTMSIQPGVRALDRYGTNMDRYTKFFLQEFFNTAHMNMSLSEIYIAPISFAPGKTDPKTGKNEQPTFKIDSVINQIEGSGQSSADDDEEEDTLMIEIDQYKQTQMQMEYFAQKYPTTKSLDGMVPMVTSPEVITSDDSQFSNSDFKKNNNAGRVGYVFSVPFYDTDSKIKGAVSAVIRTNILKSLFPVGRVALVQPKNHIEVIDKPIPEYEEAKADFSEGQNSSKLIYSDFRELKFGDVSPWQLWVVQPDSNFYSSTSVVSIKKEFYIQSFILLLIFLTVSWQLYQNGKKQEMTEGIVSVLNDSASNLGELSDFMKSDSNSLAESTQNASSASDQSAASVDEIRSMFKMTRAHSQVLKEKANHSLDSARQATEMVIQMAQSVQQIDNSNTKLFDNVEVMTHRLMELKDIILTINTKTKMIQDIVFQTKLLSFNASVEAARAGEHGKGFAIVAEEVGTLAKVSAEAAIEISTVVSDSTKSIQLLAEEAQKLLDESITEGRNNTQHGLSIAEQCQTAIHQIKEELSVNVKLSSELDQAIIEEDTGAQQILESVNLISRASSENATIAEKVKKRASEVDHESVQLREQIEQLQKLMSIR